jgi:hypothetical protein
VQYLVARNTIDERIMNAVAGKMGVIDAAAEGK